MKSTLFLLLLYLSSNALGDEWLVKLVKDKESSIKKGIENKKSPKPFFKDHVLLFFFSSTCPYCHRFSPILNAFAKKRGIKVIPLSFNGQGLAHFNRFYPVTDEWVKLAFPNGNIRYPALFILNEKNHFLYPVAVGFMSNHELENTMHRLMPKINAFEKRKLG